MTRRRTAHCLLAAIALGAMVPRAQARNYDPAAEVDHAAFDSLLARYVAPDGIRWAAWAGSEEDRATLRDYVDRLAAAEPEALTRYQRLAYWINVYNAVTLDLVLENYPVKSIKDIRSPWKRKLFTVGSQEFSLDEIENDVIRKTWKEPRVHFALNCASRSCPPLRAEAYDGRRLHDQLEDQTRRFLADTAVNRVDDKGRLHLSRIFDWYREDFEMRTPTLVHWLQGYLPTLEDRDPADVKIDFEGYDWSLNEAAE